jgi:site-specific recombinase XerD
VSFVGACLLSLRGPAGIFIYGPVFWQRGVVMGNLIPDHVSDYLSFLSVEKGLSAGSIEAQGRHLGDFFSFLEGKAASLVTDEDIRRYLAREHKKGLSGATLGHRIGSLRGFFAFLLDEGIIQDNPAKSIESPQREKPLPRFLSEK